MRRRSHSQVLTFDFPSGHPTGGRSHSPPEEPCMRVDVSGGPPVTICTTAMPIIGGTWNRDGVILSTNRARLLYRVSAAGGDPKPLRPLAEGETGQFWPQFLPDGKHYLYLSLSNRPNQQGIYVASLDSNDRKFIVGTNANAAYVQSGQLLFMRGDVLMAQPFDLRNLTLEGEPRPVADHIETGAAAGAPLPAATFCRLSQRRAGVAPRLPNLPSLYCSGSIAAARDSVPLARPQTTRTPLSHRTIRNWPSASAIRRPRPATSGSSICCAARGRG